MFSIHEPQSARFWYQLARALAIETVDGFKVVKMGAIVGPGKPSQWSHGDGIAFIQEVEVLKEGGLSVVEALRELRKLAPSRYAQLSLKTLENRYYQARPRSENQ